MQQVSLLAAQNNNHNQSQSQTQLVYLSQQPVCLFVCMHVHRVQQLEDENDEMKLNVCRLKSQTEKLDQVMFYLFIYIQLLYFNLDSFLHFGSCCSKMLLMKSCKYGIMVKRPATHTQAAKQSDWW